MHTSVRDMPQLELALLRRGVDQLSDRCERCRHCERTPLIGERVYVYEADDADAAGLILCELCRVLAGGAPLRSRIVHGPEFGHTMRITDQRTPR